jgi:tRNA A-37 threonylcarbamoyl transferase component Bud32
LTKRLNKAFNNDTSQQPNLSDTEYCKLILDNFQINKFTAVENEESCIVPPIEDGNEEEFNFAITPLLQELSDHDLTKYVTVNSERIKWLHGISSDYKPDFHVTHSTLAHLSDNKHHGGEDYLYGGLVHSIYQRDVKFIWEGKVTNLGFAEIGKMLHYCACLLKSNNYHARGVLYNDKKWIYVEYNNKVLSNIVIGEWNDRGCKNFLKNCVKNSPISPLCEAIDIFSFKFKVHAKFWLGRGADGHVFAVENSEGNMLAMKIKLNKETDDNEFHLLKSAYELIPDLVVSIVSNLESFRLRDGKTSVSFLMEIGESSNKDNDLRKAIESLVKLHKANIVHGDPRFSNLLKFGNNYKWIDFRKSLSGLNCFHSTKANDLRILLKSKFLNATNEDIIDKWFVLNSEQMDSYGVMEDESLAWKIGINLAQYLN